MLSMSTTYGIILLMTPTLTNIHQSVSRLLGADCSGHDMPHINRVFQLSQKFATLEHANLELTGLIALLHDVDDYKLFGQENAAQLPNARYIMNDAGVNEALQTRVLHAIQEIGYGKRLRGIKPSSPESRVVSDADMCDDLGTSGILRTYAYGQKIDRPFFNPTIFPRDHLTADQYVSNDHPTTSICHFFEKILRLPGLMLTNSGKTEAAKRCQFTIDFLYHFFDENNAPEWRKYLDNYLSSISTL